MIFQYILGLLPFFRIVYKAKSSPRTVRVIRGVDERRIFVELNMTFDLPFFFAVAC